MENKVTKSQIFTVVAEYFTEYADFEMNGVTAVDIADAANVLVEQLATKAAKAKERAAKRKAEGDELREVVFSVVTDEPQTRDEITAQIDGEDITPAKVGARLTQLVNAGSVVKEQVTTDGHRHMVYKLA